MHHYPVFLSLAGRSCLVVGAGKVGIRKISTLLAAEPKAIIVLDQAPPSEAMRELAEDPVVTFEQRTFDESDLDSVFLAIAATASESVNSDIASLCEQRNILCNIADAPHLSSFIVPSCVQRGDLRLAISTGGHSPALARRLRRDLESVFGPEYERLTALLGELRPLILARNMETKDNTTLFRAIVESDLLSALAEEDLDRAASHLREILPEDMHDTIGEILHADT